MFWPCFPFSHNFFWASFGTPELCTSKMTKRLSLSHHSEWCFAQTSPNSPESWSIRQETIGQRPNCASMLKTSRFMRKRNRVSNNMFVRFLNILHAIISYLTWWSSATYSIPHLSTWNILVQVPKREASSARASMTILWEVWHCKTLRIPGVP